MFTSHTSPEHLNGKALTRIFDVHVSCSKPHDVAPKWFIGMLHYRPKAGQGLGLSFIVQKVAHKYLSSCLKL